MERANIRFTTQAFVHGSPADQLSLVSSVDALAHDLNLWMSSNRLCLNSAKTQLIWFWTRQQLLKLDLPLLTDKFPLLLTLPVFEIWVSPSTPPLPSPSTSRI